MKFLASPKAALRNSLRRIFSRPWWFFRTQIETKWLGTRMPELWWKWRSLFHGKHWPLAYLSTMEHPHRSRIIQALQKFDQPSSLLEVGCNSGPNLILISKNFPQMQCHGIDINRDAIRIGTDYVQKNELHNIQLDCGSIRDLQSYPTQSIDVVLSDAVLIYIDPNQISSVLNNLIRISKKGLILHEYHSETPPPDSYFSGRYVHDYKKLLPIISPHAALTFEKSFSSCKTDGWGLYGHLIVLKH